MSGLPRVFLFAVLLAVVFGGAALAGAAIGPSGADGDDGQAGHGEPKAGGGGEHADMGAEPAGGESAKDAGAPPGVQVAQDGYRLVVERTRLEAAGREPMRFRILGPDGQPLRDFELQHEKRMHLILVRRDLAGFQHVHPQMAPDGTWEIRVNWPSAGTYRVFADFMAAGTKRTLGADVHVGGSFRPRALARPSSRAMTGDGLQVTIKAGDFRAGRESRVEFEVRRDGRVVNDELRPYLGAKGHLVALREGDLAYLHTHPDSDRLAFMATYPTAGEYRLFAQFLSEGVVQTAAFTIEVSR